MKDECFDFFMIWLIVYFLAGAH